MDEKEIDMLKNRWLILAIFALALTPFITVILILLHTQPPAPQPTALSRPAPTTEPLPQEDPFVTCHGTLVDENDKPVPSAPFTIYQTIGLWPDTLIEAHGTTGPHGEITYGPVPRGKNLAHKSILFDLPGHAVTCAGLDTAHTLISGETKPWLVKLHPPTSISGRITNEKGDPIENAVVETAGSNGSLFNESNGYAVHTDHDGRFHFDRIPQGTDERFLVAIKHPAYASFSTEANKFHAIFTVKPGTTDFDAVLHPGATLHAQLTSSGKPLAKANIHFVALQGANKSGEVAWGISDKTGRIDFTGLSPGTWTLLPRNLESDPDIAPSRVQAITVKTGEEQNIQIDCAPGEILQGIARDPDTYAPSQEPIYFYFPDNRIWPVITATPDAQGHFTARLPVGKYRLRSLGWKDFDLKNAFADIDITADKPNTVTLDVGVRRPIRGQLVDEQGNGIPGFVSIDSDAIQTAPDGHFVLWPNYFFDHLSYGFAIDAEHKRACGFLLTSDDASEEQRLVLEPTATITGQVVDENKIPVPHAKISVQISVGQMSWIPEDDAPWKITTGNDNSFRITSVPVGIELQVRADLSGDDQAESVTALEPGEERTMRPMKLNMDITKLPPPTIEDAEISGIVLDENGAPAPGVDVEAQPLRSNKGYADETDFKGRFTLKNLPRQDQMDVIARVEDGKYIWYRWKITPTSKPIDLRLDPEHLQK